MQIENANWSKETLFNFNIKSAVACTITFPDKANKRKSKLKLNTNWLFFSLSYVSNGAKNKKRQHALKFND